MPNVTGIHGLALLFVILAVFALVWAAALLEWWWDR